MSARTHQRRGRRGAGVGNHRQTKTTIRVRGASDTRHSVSLSLVLHAFACCRSTLPRRHRGSQAATTSIASQQRGQESKEVCGTPPESRDREGTQSAFQEAVYLSFETGSCIASYIEVILLLVNGNTGHLRQNTSAQHTGVETNHGLQWHLSP